MGCLRADTATKVARRELRQRRMFLEDPDTIFFFKISLEELIWYQQNLFLLPTPLIQARQAVALCARGARLPALRRTLC